MVEPTSSQPDTKQTLRGEHVPDPVNTRVAYARNRYLKSQVNVLVTRYAQIRGDFIVSIGTGRVGTLDPEKHGHVEKVSSSLQEAKKELERPKKPNLPLVANHLSQAERSLIAFYPEKILAHKAGLVMEELRVVAPDQRRMIDSLEARIEAARTGPIPDGTRHVLQDARLKLDEVEEDVLIQEELQEARLRRARSYLIGALLIILVAVPITTEIKKVNDHVVWPVLYTPQVLHDGRLNDIMFLVLGAIGLALVGATGGIISGMFSVRSTRAKLNDYRTSMLNVGLRPLIGATAAICVCLFLTWGTINGIEVTSEGTFAIAAFLAGFSERYFLGFLQGQESAALEQIERDAPQASAPRR